MYEDRKGQQVLAVKVTHKCGCDTSNWKEMACGHAFCTLCDGYVDVESKVVVKGPGPIFKCCRKPLNKREYSWLFSETGVYTGILSREMENICLHGRWRPRGNMTSGRMPRQATRTTSGIKGGFERRKKEAKARMVYYSHCSASQGGRDDI